jgi:N-acyl-D-aspartate/D-glutamate deacylase
MGRAGRALTAVAAVLCTLRPAGAAARQTQYDLLIRGGTVVDGTGGAGYRADVALVGDRIVRIAREGIAPELARRVLDARGLTVAPGFIDTHAHVDDLADRPLAESFLRQGVTTVIYAPDGGQPWPLARAIERLRDRGHAPNTAFFAGHNTIRSEVMGSADRAPTPAELERMKAMVAQTMEQGAIGLSTGLRYVPGIYSRTEEVIALARVAAEHGGFYASHIRDEGEGVVESVREVVRIAREARIPAQVSHHKIMGQPQWGQSVQTLALVDSARAAGLDVTIDQYAYTATSTGTAVLFPAWSLAGGGDSLRARLADPARRARIEQGIRATILEERGGGDLARIQLARVGFRPEWNGRTFADIAKERAEEPTLDFAVRLAIEIQQNGGASGVWHVVDEADVRRIMQHPFTMISSDGGIGVPGAGHPHPRNYGAFARVLGHYVREQKVLTLEEAVRKMTSLPAWRIGQPERGRLAEGAFADVVVFDPATITDRATFEDPHQFAIGVSHVVINGVPVLVAGSLTGEKPGRVLVRVPAARTDAGASNALEVRLDALLAIGPTHDAVVAEKRR